MAPATAADTGAEAKRVDRAALEQALSSHSPEQLKETAVRLTKSIEGLKEMLQELEDEQRSLATEGDELNNTITLMMGEMQKLKISSDNTVEPQLLEGPLDFIGRIWEKHRPRDTAYQTSEHVGELRKLGPDESPPQRPDVRAVVQEASQQVVNTAQKIQGGVGTWWVKTQGFLAEKQSELTARAAAQLAAHKESSAKKTSKRSKDDASAAAGYPNGAGVGLGEAQSRAAPDATAVGSSSAAAAEPPAPAAEAPAAAAAVPTETPETVEAQAESPEDAAATTESEAKVEKSGSAGANEEESILISAKITLDDGSEKTLEVKATDRSKEVAQRFVQEHSLKAWFQDPLTKWLKEVEKEADEFPVFVSGDLLEIRKKFSKGK